MLFAARPLSWAAEGVRRQEEGSSWSHRPVGAGILSPQFEVGGGDARRSGARGLCCLHCTTCKTIWNSWPACTFYQQHQPPKDLRVLGTVILPGRLVFLCLKQENGDNFEINLNPAVFRCVNDWQQAVWIIWKLHNFTPKHPEKSFFFPPRFPGSGQHPHPRSCDLCNCWSVL